MINTQTHHLLIRIISMALAVAFIFCLSACGSSLSGKIGKNSVWKTEPDEDNSLIKWTFEGESIIYTNVINGEDTFSQNFKYSIDGNKIIFESNYATLTFDATIDGEIMTIKTESGETLVFKKQ